MSFLEYFCIRQELKMNIGTITFMQLECFGMVLVFRSCFLIFDLENRVLFL